MIIIIVYLVLEIEGDNKKNDDSNELSQNIIRSLRDKIESDFVGASRDRTYESADAVTVAKKESVHSRADFLAALNLIVIFSALNC